VFYERTAFDAAQRKQIVGTKEWQLSRQEVKQHAFGGARDHQAREVIARIHWQSQGVFRTAI
jgi:lysozyme family protein